MRTTITALSLALLTGCGGSTENGANDAGVGGSTGGSGGTVQTGGSGGGGGTVQTGGSGPVVGECKTDDDCELGSSCCDCVVAPKGKLEMPYCPPEPCFADQCSAQQVSQARCVAGQCILGYECDPSTVFCNALPPECPPGQLPRVENGCWGPCVPADQCLSVPDCFGCPNGTVCVVFDAWTSTHHCITPPAGCEASCNCLGKLVCVDGFDACGEMDDGSAVHCSCPTC